MALRRIVTGDDEILRKKCRVVTEFDERLWLLLDDMKDTLYKADGVGLAAPQVGILRRAAIVLETNVPEGEDEYIIELINPEIISIEGEQTGPEGCLSVPGRSGIVVRPERVTVRAQNAHGEPIEVTGEGFLARAFCHEIDHLDGILYVDKMVREIFPDEEEEDGEAETDGEEEGQ